RGRGRTLLLLGPDHSSFGIAPAILGAGLGTGVETSWAGEVDGLLADLELSGRRGGRVRRALFREYLGTTPIGGCWLVRPEEATGARRPAPHGVRLGDSLGAPLRPPAEALDRGTPDDDGRPGRADVRPPDPAGPGGPGALA